MIPSTIIKQLQQDVKLYLLFWDEWTNSDYCFLSDREIGIINDLKRSDFTVRLNSLVKYFKEGKDLRRLDEKLQNESHQFKEWIAYSFLMSLVNISKNKGGESFFYKEICNLDISPVLKDHLIKMRITTLKDLIDKYADTYLVINPLFEHIINFKLSYAREYHC